MTHECPRRSPRLAALALRRGPARLLCALLAVAAVIGLTVLAAPAVRADDDLVAHRLRIPLTSGARSVTLWVAKGFEIGLAATDVTNARVIAQAPSGELVVSQMFEGKV